MDSNLWTACVADDFVNIIHNSVIPYLFVIVPEMDSILITNDKSSAITRPYIKRN